MSFTRRHVIAGSAASAVAASRVLGANNRIRLGAIGTEGRCQSFLDTALKAGGCEFAAVSDVNATRAAQARDKFAAQAKIVPDYRRLLEDKSIDAVIIGSPDHWHVAMLADAVAASKDVYIQKPLTRTMEEGQRANDAVTRSGRVVQVGYQQRSYRPRRRQTQCAR
jgi:predicted dehydrogenase